MFGFIPSDSGLPRPQRLPDKRGLNDRDLHLLSDSQTRRVFFKTNCELSAILRAESIAGALRWESGRCVIMTSVWFDDIDGFLKTRTTYFHPEPIYPDGFYGDDTPDL